MSSRVSKAVLLCEDQQHQRLAIAFLKQCGIKNPGRILTSKVASQLKEGGNVGWVMDEFPRERRAFRQRQVKAETLLIVMIDADKGSVEDRRKELNERAERAGLKPIGPDESVALLVPKRHIETWIRALLDDTVTEEDDCKTKAPATKEELRQAAQRLHEWSRPNDCCAANAS
jgi:hypothetical protein